MTTRFDYASSAPEGYKAIAGAHAYLHRCGLALDLIDLVFLRVSQINGCAYCIDKHSRDLVRRGTSVDKLVLVPVWQEASQLFSERERAALAWAESVTRVAETGVPDEAYAAVAAHFDDKELADLTYAIAIMNALNRLAISSRKTPTAAERR